MFSGLSLLQLLGLALLAGLTMALKLILDREYTSWASALARLLTWLAGTLYGRRREEWWADLRYAQKDGKQTAVLQAASWLASAPGLYLRDAAAAAIRRRRRRRRTGSHPVYELLVSLLAEKEFRQKRLDRDK